MISSNGEIVYTITIIPATEVTLKLFSGMVFLGWDDAGMVKIPAEKFADIPADAIMTVTYTVDNSSNAWTQLAFIGIGWTHDYSMKTEGGFAFTKAYIPSDEIGDAYWSGSFDNLEAKIVLDAENLKILKEKGLAICGGNGNTTVTKVTVDYKISLEVDIAGQVKTNSGKDITYPFSFQWAADGQINLTKDFLLGLGVKKGSKLIIYKDPTAKGQVQINNSSWKAIYTISDWTPSLEVLEQEFDDAMMAGLNGGGFWIQGDLGGVKKICILP